MLPGLIGNSIRAALPIASRVLNPRELLIAGVLTRMGTGLLRIEENIPTAKRKPQLSREQKYASLYERIFMEAIGVPFQVITMYLLQDPAAKLFERSKFLQVPTANALHSDLLAKLVPAERQAITSAMKKIYLPAKSLIPHNIVSQQIYDRLKVLAKVGDVKRLVAQTLHGTSNIEALSPTVLKGVESVLMGYQRRLWVAAAITLGAGVLGSAYLTGYLMQWLNDNPVSKKIIPWILRQLDIAPREKVQEVPMPGPVPTIPARTFKV